MEAQDFFGDCFRIAHDERPGRSEQGVVLCTGDWRPAAFLADLRKASRITGKEFIGRLLRAISDVAQRVDTHLELVWRMAGTPTGPAVAVDQRPKTVRLAPNDRDHQR